MPIPKWLRENNNNNEELLTASKTKVIIGQFYEILAAKIFNGEYNNKAVGQEMYPDVIVWKGFQDILYEVKASSLSNRFTFDLGQQQYYKDLINTEFPFTNPKTYYSFFVYELKEPLYKTYIYSQELIEGLITHTKACLILPLEIVNQFKDWFVLSTYINKSWSDRRIKKSKLDIMFVRIPATRIINWVNNTEVLKTDFKNLSIEFGYRDFNIKNYKFKRRIVSRFKILNQTISSFPLLEMIEKEK